MQCCLEPLRQHCTRFLPVQCCPKSIKTTLNRIFPVQCCLEPLGQHGTRFFQFLCNVVLRKFKTTLKNIFLVQCCLQPQGQHYIDFILWNIVPKVFRRHCTGFFSCAMLSAASWATVHKVFTCAILSQEYQGNIEQNFSGAMLSQDN